MNAKKLAKYNYKVIFVTSTLGLFLRVLSQRKGTYRIKLLGMSVKTFNKMPGLLLKKEYASAKYIHEH